MSDILANLKAVLKTTPLRWNALTANYPETLLRYQPLPGEWSPLECLQHLIDLDRGVFPQRVRALLAGENFPAFFPDEDGTQLMNDISPQALAAEFEALRKENLLLVDELTPDDLSKEAVHAELGTVSLGNLLHEWGGHDLMHLVQAERAIMQPFIEGCGAWRIYFLDHVARE